MMTNQPADFAHAQIAHPELFWSGESIISVSVSSFRDADELMRRLAGINWQGPAALGTASLAVYFWLANTSRNAGLLCDAVGGRYFVKIDRAPVELLDL